MFLAPTDDSSSEESCLSVPIQGHSPTWSGNSWPRNDTQVQTDEVAGRNNVFVSASAIIGIAFTSITDCSVADVGWLLDNAAVAACTP